MQTAANESNPTLLLVGFERTPPDTETATIQSEPLCHHVHCTCLHLSELRRHLCLFARSWRRFFSGGALINFSSLDTHYSVNVFKLAPYSARLRHISILTVKCPCNVFLRYSVTKIFAFLIIIIIIILSACRLYVCPIRACNCKTKAHRKPELVWTFPTAWVTNYANIQFKPGVWLVTTEKVAS